MASAPKHRRSGRARRGFTLIEALLAVSVSTIMVYVLWNLFVSGATQMDKGTFMSKSQGQLRLGLQFMQERASKASYLTIIDGNKITTYKDAPRQVHFKEGTFEGACGPFLQFAMCEHGRKNVGGEDAKPEREVLASFAVEEMGEGLNRSPSLTYEATEVTSTGTGAEAKQVLVENVEKIVVEGIVTGDEEKGSLRITITTTHPNKAKFPETKAFHKTELAFRVQANADL